MLFHIGQEDLQDMLNKPPSLVCMLLSFAWLGDRYHCAGNPMSKNVITIHQHPEAVWGRMHRNEF
ncbi:hypothetical protein AC579_5668 [Pseudocercospora musae]|uniref:Uncharacterized protein n=1 Tax=Pseudocercospora musae TaxID=113226 RepID=A0A139IC18_9PEZI|nr:hypothetical protein AC579_5668 [Pseudocercospora musae]